MKTKGNLSDKQIELLRQVWGETVSRVRQLGDTGAIASEWLALQNGLQVYVTEARARHRMVAQKLWRIRLLDSGIFKAKRVGCPQSEPRSNVSVRKKKTEC